MSISASLRSATDARYLREAVPFKTPHGEAQEGFELLGLATIRVGEVNLVVESRRRKIEEERVFLGVESQRFKGFGLRVVRADMRSLDGEPFVDRHDFDL